MGRGLRQTTAMGRRHAIASALAIIALVGLFAASGWFAEKAVADGSGGSEPSPDIVEPAKADRSGRWIALGGGSLPELNQVSIEQDLALARDVLGADRGHVLFAGGPDSRSVQVLDPAPRGDALMMELAGIFSPRSGRDAHYRKTTLTPAGPATVESALQAIQDELARPDAKGGLLLYLAGHGEQGEAPRNNLMRLWGQGALTATAMAETLDAAPASRQVRMVATTCFSGGFAEIVFVGADSAKGAAKGDRCGLFASPWDLEASGCDPDPDRRKHQGYGVHFLNALQGRARDGKPLPLEQLDLDKDGVISLLEAHTRARIASASWDVPTTTSERWLRYVGLVAGDQKPVALPEEDAVIQAMATRLGISGSLAEAQSLQSAVNTAVEVALADLADSRDSEDLAFRALAADLLTRWPVIDDPWHPDFGPTVRQHRAAITEFLAMSPRFARYREAITAVDRLDSFVSSARVKAAPVERLVRAHQNKLLASRLAAVGGTEWAVYEQLLACERSAP
ncbi:MAG: hypothetical protein ACI9WU_001916 [Myxococcota bacterium]|jgi:hypothetical protein